MAVVGGRFALRLLGLAVVVVFAFGVVACGDSDDAGDASARTESQSPAEQEIEKSLDAAQQAFNDGDWRAACSVMSAETQKQFKALENHKTCEKAVADLFTDDASGRPTYEAVGDIATTSIVVKGDRAVVTGKQEGRNGELTAEVVNENGDWKVVRLFDDR